MAAIRIAHLADVHVRGGLQRHAEYKQTFQTFYESCVKNQVTHIFIAGDLWHTKTQGFSPEAIDFLSEWFTEMAKVAEVHVMLGNHDFNLSNLSRQDAISPIIRALNNPRIFLYKESGVYPFAVGYNFCVFSLYDPERWDSVKPTPGDFNIACFHDPVYGATTETDWEVEGEMRVEYFKDFDVCMLGDIHRQQFLDERSVIVEIDEADLDKYPGALMLSEMSAERRLLAEQTVLAQAARKDEDVVQWANKLAASVSNADD